MTSTASPTSVSGPLEQHPVDEAEACVATARRYLQHDMGNGHRPFDIDDDGLVQLAAQLKQHSRFTYARRVLFKLRKTNDKLQETLREEHALCTYKDKDLPADRRFDRALRILAHQEEEDETASIDVPTLLQSESIETLGQIGSIYRRLWERDLHRRNLQLAYAFYRKGYEKASINPEQDSSMLAWTGINAAFVLELIAREEPMHDALAVTSVVDAPPEHGATDDGSDSAQTEGRFRRHPVDEADDTTSRADAGDAGPHRVSLRVGARKLREQLIEKLEGTTETRWQEYQMKRGQLNDRPSAAIPSPAEQQQNDDLWWLMSTLGEAYFGIGGPDSDEWDAAKEWFKRAGDVDGIQQWHLESTTRRITQLAQIQVDLYEPDVRSRRKDGGRSPGKRRSTSAAQRFAESDRGQVLAPFLGEGHSEAVSSSFRGKVGLALSGGGFRASLFHLGVLARLAELDILRHVEVISCVSGGSILGACYYLKLRHLLEDHTDNELSTLGPKAYVDLVNELIDEFLEGVQKNLRTRLFTNPLSNLRMMLDPRYTRTERAADLFEKMFFRRVDHPLHERASLRDRLLNAPSKERRWRLHELSITPADAKRTGDGEDGQFHPRYENWHRANKVPMFIVNASTLNTGHNWQFTGNWMGEPPGRIATEVDANHRLRRLYLKDAPDPYQTLRLGSAVAASACVPGLFEPITFSKLYEKQHIVRLVDGGVYDNQGVGALLEEDCNVILISDASGQMTSQTDPPEGTLGVPLRANTILMERVRQAQFGELDARRGAGLLRHMMFVHLTKDLEMVQVDWLQCPDPVDPSFDRPEKPKPGRTTYGINDELQRALSSTRTDLDSFTEVEAYALMNSGYQMAVRYTPRDIGTDENNRFAWPFLDIAPHLDVQQPDSDLLRHLETATHRFFRLPRYLDATWGGWLKRASVIVAVLLVGSLGWRTVGSAIVPNSLQVDVPVTAMLRALLIAALFFGLLMAWPRFRRWLPAFLMRVILGTVGFVLAWAHLLTFNWMYLKLGTLARFRPPERIDKR